MARGRRTVGGIAAAVLVLAGYGVADAADVVPGVLTTDPPPAAAEPFPDVSLPGGDLVAPTVEGADAGAPAPTPAGLEALATEFADDYRRTGSFGLVVADAITGETLLDHDGATPRLPASSLKVLTAAAALDALGADRVLTTSAVQPAEGRVVLVGAGDVLLGAGESDPHEVVGRAGLADLAARTAAALAEQGTTSVQVDVDDSLFTGAVHHPDWQGIDLTFVMPVQALAVEAGRIGNAFVDDPALEAGAAFADALGEHGIEVVGNVGRRTVDPEAEVLGEVESATIGEIVRHTLKVSDNSVAEVLARLVAVERGATPDFAGATSAVRQQIAELGVDVSGVQIADGSGLSESNRVPAAVLVDVLRTAGGPDGASLHGLLPGMPVSGLDGTLADRLTGDAAGRVRAKTGTLIRAISLTGTVVTADGRPLLLSVLASDLEVGTALQARLAVDSLVRSLAACGCR
ncbi:D-alanyl-D-alanine carboxypeptidase/D-alanyl-D-alanine endopeptidase [Georgenia subflava]|uniref:D-alanyl-D-alanine carboxypeptidase/D-alanyl-D-alanine endopeptidase n=1 Tax=Georgenia subflava TaxID=1622177 RepID=UPI00128D7F47|nr:D-alanyl-D-alanine carboxypeptidase/D-alanyl-D-alanine-endopeptidase [Georgenia subflava]